MRLLNSENFEHDFNEGINIYTPLSIIDLLKWHLNDEKLHSPWLFRGQNNFDWPLSSTLERAKNKLSNQSNSHINIYKLENRIIKEFEKSKPHFRNKSKIEKLAYLQHYGYPTRLIDFTDNINVALFFAINEDKFNYSSLYAINYKTVEITTLVSLSSEEDLISNGLKYCDVKDILSIDKFLLRNTFGEKVTFINPPFTNDRIEAQSGCFMLSSNLEIPFSHCVKKTVQTVVTESPHPVILKIRLTPKVKSEIKEYLDKENINSETLRIRL